MGGMPATHSKKKIWPLASPLPPYKRSIFPPSGPSRPTYLPVLRSYPHSVLWSSLWSYPSFLPFGTSVLRPSRPSICSPHPYTPLTNSFDALNPWSWMWNDSTVKWISWNAKKPSTPPSLNSNTSRLPFLLVVGSHPMTKRRDPLTRPWIQITLLTSPLDVLASSRRVVSLV